MSIIYITNYNYVDGPIWRARRNPIEYYKKHIMGGRSSNHHVPFNHYIYLLCGLRLLKNGHYSQEEIIYAVDKWALTMQDAD